MFLGVLITCSPKTEVLNRRRLDWPFDTSLDPLGAVPTRELKHQTLITIEGPIGDWSFSYSHYWLYHTHVNLVVLYNF